MIIRKINTTGEQVDLIDKTLTEIAAELVRHNNLIESMLKQNKLILDRVTEAQEQKEFEQRLFREQVEAPKE